MRVPVPLPQGGYQLAEASLFDHSFRIAPENVDGFLHEAYGAYTTSMERVISQTVMLGYLTYMTAQASRAASYIPFSEGSAQADVEKYATDEEACSYNSKIDAYADECKAKGEAGFRFHGRTPTYPDEPANAFMYGQGMGQIASISNEMGRRDHPINAGIEAVLFSMVMNSYAAFEAFAGDLWVAMVDAQPALVVGKEGELGSVALSLQSMESGDVAPSLRMGRYLRRREAVTFQTLDGIKKLYRWTFGEDSGVIESFAPEHELYRTSLVRNVIAHKAGRMDDKFRKNATRIPGSDQWTGLLSAKDGDPLEVTGPLVKRLIDPCVKTSVNLLRFAQEWTACNRNTAQG